METKTMTQVAPFIGSKDAIRAAKRRILVDRLAHAKVRFAQCEFDAITYQPRIGVVAAREELDRFALELELDLADETITSLEDRVLNHDEETRILSNG